MKPAARVPWLVVIMVLAVAAVAALAVWDAERESSAALSEFAEEQATLARCIALDFAARLPSLPVDTASREQLLGGSLRVEEPGELRVLFLDARVDTLLNSDGDIVKSEPIRRGLDAGRLSVWLDRREASALGLPPRRAAAGLAVIDGGHRERWGIAVVRTAKRVRDRQRHTRGRAALGTLLGAGLVIAFGSLALRRQRRGLLLERELALSALARERDAELATATKAATMGTLAMGIAHEVSTPLGIIAGRAEQLATRVEGDERAGRAVQAILDQSERIRRTVRGFLDLVRGEAPALGDTDPASVLDGAVALVSHRLAAAHVKLDRDVPEGLPAIHCDLPMLQQALVNLLLNACDACGPGGHIAASIRVEGESVIFTVADDGPGITKEAAARAAEPFFTTKARGQGSGLGLAITSEIVKLHRGSLNIEPASPRGTRASVIIPTPKVKADAA